jgi:hypothetical protein
MNEFNKLVKMMKEAGWNFRVYPLFGGKQVRLFSDAECTNEIDDCICCPGSFGYREGLLETYRLNDCDGDETAEQVFEGWKKMLEEQKQK